MLAAPSVSNGAIAYPAGFRARKPFSSTGAAAVTGLRRCRFLHRATRGWKVTPGHTRRRTGTALISKGTAAPARERLQRGSCTAGSSHQAPPAAAGLDRRARVLHTGCMGALRDLALFYRSLASCLKPASQVTRALATERNRSRRGGHARPHRTRRYAAGAGSDPSTFPAVHVKLLTIRSGPAKRRRP